jgi:hypothetical protein
MTKDEVLASILDALENHIEDPRQARLIDSLIKDIKLVTTYDTYFFLAEGRDGVTRFFRHQTQIPAGFFILGKIKLEHL